MTLKSATLGLICLLTLVTSMVLAHKPADTAASKIKRITNHLKRKSSLPTPQYPTANRDTTTDDYHGTTVADPYRWLEDDYKRQLLLRHPVLTVREHFLSLS